MAEKGNLCHAKPLWSVRSVRKATDEAEKREGEADSGFPKGSVRF